MVRSLPQPIGRQKEVLCLPADGHTVVLGTAGSGKTTLAIYRSLFLADPSTDHNGRTLLVTFSRCLVSYLESLAGGIPHQLDVVNYHRFARGYLNHRGRMRSNCICNPDLAVELLEQAVAEARRGGSESPVLDRPIELVMDECRWLAQHGITTADEYVSAERVGRAGARIVRAERPTVFAAYDRYRALRRQQGKEFDWQDLSHAVVEEFAKDNSRRHYPIQCLDGIANRCNGQLYNGDRTHIGWTAREVVLPTMPTSIASGAIIKVAGITGRIRGMKYKRADGQTMRPSLVVIDDPQTDESARSLSQCATRESILAGAILGLAGPGKKISGIMPCTVIRPSDMADNILSRDKHPEWNGERTKMVYAFPTDEKLWERYGELRGESLRMHGDIRAATEFYDANREAMDAGAEIAWLERFNHDEVSAIQHAMNLRLQDEAAFFAEYQNEPLPEVTGTEDELQVDQIAGKVNRMKRCEVPIGCNHLTMFIDVQANLLFFVVAAWEDDFTGYVVDYGTFPDQKRSYFTLRDARNTLALATKASGLEGSIYAGLEQFTAKHLVREWQRDDGAMLRIERCLVDANWGSSTDVVYQFCRQSPHAGVVMPSHGRFVGASSQPFSEYKRKQGDRIGHNWRMPNVHGKRAVRHVVYDTNYWKSFVHARLAVPMGDRGCLSLFGDSPDQHRLFAEHITSEYRVKTEGRGRTVDEWKMRPERGDNHWFDCLVGCAAAGSIQGAVLAGAGGFAQPARRERVSFAELQRRKQG